MADKKEYKLKQTKGNFKLNGIIVGISNDKSYSEGENKENVPYKSIRFGIKTSPTNIINVELYGQEQEFVYAYSKTDEKTLKVLFADRGKKLADSYHMIGVNVTIGEEERETYAPLDAVEVIYKGFSDGDSVYVTGELKPNSYIDSNGEVVNKFVYNIKSISTNKKPVDFDSDKFKETSSFDQEVVIKDTKLDKKTNKVIVNGYAIGYADSFKDMQFTIHNDKNEKLASNFLKLKFGDYIKVLGNCINSPALEVVDDDWGSEVPSGYKTGGKYICELRIMAVAKDKDGVSIFKKAKYTETDFIKEDEEFTEVATETVGDDDELPF